MAEKKREGEKEEGEAVERREEVVFPYVLKHFPSATNLRAAHGSYARVRLAFFLFSPAVLTGQLGANHRSKVNCQALFIFSVFIHFRISTHLMRHNSFSI